MQGGHRNATRLIGILTAVLGVALIARTIASGGGPLALGVVIGAAFVLLGGGRVYMAARSSHSQMHR
ncbi:MAG: hypothetical protein NVSMB25_01300 [Thermoleophilaceae bacterium]